MDFLTHKHIYTHTHTRIQNWIEFRHVFRGTTRFSHNLKRANKIFPSHLSATRTPGPSSTRLHWHTPWEGERESRSCISHEIERLRYVRDRSANFLSPRRYVIQFYYNDKNTSARVNMTRARYTLTYAAQWQEVVGQNCAHAPSVRPQ